MCLAVCVVRLSQVGVLSKRMDQSRKLVIAMEASCHFESKSETKFSETLVSN